MGIVIPPRTDPYTGQTVFTTEDRYNDLMGRYNADQSFLGSFSQGIPGLTGPVGSNTSIPLPGRPVQPPSGQPPGGLLSQPLPAQPPPQQQPIGGPPPGQYGRQALAMAGLLSSPQQPPSGGMLGGGRRGFRIPGGK